MLRQESSVIHANLVQKGLPCIAVTRHFSLSLRKLPLFLFQLFVLLAIILNSNKDFYAKLGVGTDAEKFIAFMLNERSRELIGELMRWEDLARTKTLVKGCLTFNDEAKPLENKHYLRPIPQSFLDANNKDGKPHTPAEKVALQNPNW